VSAGIANRVRFIDSPTKGTNPFSSSSSTAFWVLRHAREDDSWPPEGRVGGTRWRREAAAADSLGRGAHARSRGPAAMAAAHELGPPRARWPAGWPAGWVPWPGSQAGWAAGEHAAHRSARRRRQA
jgi:hypothetical protein